MVKINDFDSDDYDDEDDVDGDNHKDGDNDIPGNMTKAKDSHHTCEHLKRIVIFKFFIFFIVEQWLFIIDMSLSYHHDYP